MVDFRFESEKLLFLLLVIPALIIFSSWLKKMVQKKLHLFATEKSLSWLIKSGNTTSSFRSFFYYLSLTCFIFALARPQANPIIEERSSTSLDIMLLLDVSRSMDAEDIYPSRLKKAKKSIQTLLEKISGDRVGIVAFAGSAVLICPLTSDYEIVRTFLQAVDSNTIQNQGTNIKAALDATIRAFERGSQNALEKNSVSHLIVLMSDGEETVKSDSLDAAEMAKNHGAIIHTIAFGTEKGVPIPIRNDRGQLMGYKRDSKGESVISAVQPHSLREIAKAGGGNFYFSTLNEEEIKDILQKSLALQRSAQKNIKAKIYQEYFFYPLFLGFLCLLVSYFPALSFFLKRKKHIVTSILFSLLIPLVSKAEPEKNIIPSFSWKALLWNEEKRNTEKGKENFANEAYTNASDIFKELQARNPNSGTLAYNLGTSYIKEKKYEEARATLEEASKQAAIAPLAKFNLAGSYAEEKKNNEAREEYASLVHNLSEKKDLTSEEKIILQMAKKNLEHLSEKQQKNNPQQKPDEKQKDKKDGSEQNSKNEDKKEQKPDEKKGNEDKDNEQKKDYDLKKKKNDFKEREDLSEDDAKKILENLRQQEGLLQKKFLKQKEVKKTNETEKDW